MAYYPDYDPFWQFTLPDAPLRTRTINPNQIQQQPQQPPEEALTFRILNRNFDKQDLQNLIVGAKQDYQQEIANIRAELVSKREMLVAQVAELDNQIRMRIAEAKETYRLVEEEMKRKIRALEEENLKDRNVMALRKLPIEIMGTIFAECVKILDMSPRVLALVCKFWYNVAIKTPTLWNRLMITNDPEVYWLTHRAKGRRPADLNAPVFGSAARPMGSGTRSLSATQICTDINELTSALKRAGNAKLDVTIAFGDNMISPTLGQKYMYEHLFTEDVSKRIARLEVDRTPLGRELNNQVSLHGTLPNLIHLGIHHNHLDNRGIYLHLLLNADNVQEVQISVARCPLDLQHAAWWKKVKRLTLKDVGPLNNIYGGSITFEEGVTEVESELEYLSVDSVHDMTRRLGGTDPNMEDNEYIYERPWYMTPVSLAQWPNSIVTTKIIFRYLKDLTLAVSRYADLAPLILPALENFTLIITEGESQTSPLSLAEFDLVLPSLKSLRVDAPFCSPLRHIKMPRIETLSLISTCPFKVKSEEDLANSIFNTTKHIELPYLRKLALNVGVSDKFLITLLKLLPNLTHLYLVPLGNPGGSHYRKVPQLRHGPWSGKSHDRKRHVGVGFFERLYAPRRAKILQPPVCPKLRVLEVDCWRGLGLARISPEVVEAVIGKDEPQAESSGITPDDIESRFQQILDDVERLQQQQQQLVATTAMTQEQHPHVNLACTINPVQQYEPPVDAGRAESSRDYISGATAPTAEEGMNFPSPSGLEPGLPTEDVEMQQALDGERNQDDEEMNDIKMSKKREKRSEKDAIRPLVEKLVSTRRKWWDAMEKCWIRWEDGSENNFI